MRSRFHRRWCAGLVLAAAAASVAAAGWQEKVPARVLEQAERGATEFIVVLAEQADLASAVALRDRAERGARVYEILTQTAARSQAPLLAELEARGLEYRPFWIANMIWVRGSIDDVGAIAGRNEVLRLDANPTIRLEEPVGVPGAPATRAPAGIEWGILQIRADAVWNLGYTGTDIVIGGQDTGYEWNHPALIDHYRGWDGVTPDHDYNWHDAIHSGGGSCGADSPEPCDDHNHGTHTMGIMVGDDGGSNRIGVAPGARWIGCRNMDQGNGTPATYSECFQWFVAPTDGNGLNPDPSKAPHVINNSWTCPPSEGCAADTLKIVVQNTRAAGIVVVASAGNAGSSCGSVSAPPAIYDAALSVGASDASDEIAGFSSRGPVTVDGSDRLKPDVAAPGVGIRSSIRGGTYATFNGTSTAGPHVVGAIALLLDAIPDLSGPEAEWIMRLSASPETSVQDCGNYPGSEVPNAVFGYGRIDVLEAVVGDADGDGVDNQSDCAPLASVLWSAPGSVVDLQVAKYLSTPILFWSVPAPGGVDSPTYDVLQSTEAADFGDATCLGSDLTWPATPAAPNPEGIFYYLVRAGNACGDDLGSGSGGVARSASACP